MIVHVVAFGRLREMAGIEAPGRPHDVDVREGATVGDILITLGVPHELLFSVLIDGERASIDVPVPEGAELTLMPPFTGGAS